MQISICLPNFMITFLKWLTNKKVNTTISSDGTNTFKIFLKLMNFWNLAIDFWFKNLYLNTHFCLKKRNPIRIKSKSLKRNRNQVLKKLKKSPSQKLRRKKFLRARRLRLKFRERKNDILDRNSYQNSISNIIVLFLRELRFIDFHEDKSVSCQWCLFDYSTKTWFNH